MTDEDPDRYDRDDRRRGRRDDYDDRRRDDYDDRPPRRRRPDDDYDDRRYDDRSSGRTRPNGMATAAVVLGVLALCGGVTAIPGLICGIVGYNRSKERGTGGGASVAGIVLSVLGLVVAGPALFIALLLPAVQKVREAAGRQVSQNNLKLVGLGMQNYDSAQGALPAQAIRNKDGKKLLSWRVAILPYIEEDALYHRFKLDEPWDSPTNKPLIALIPKCYVTPSHPGAPGSGETYLKVFSGPNTVFKERPPAKVNPKDKPLGIDGRLGFPLSYWSIASLTSSPRGTSNLILCVEAGDPVIWTKPDDFEYDPNRPLPDLKPLHPGGILALRCDGAVMFLKKPSEAMLRAGIDPSSNAILPVE